MNANTVWGTLDCIYCVHTGWRLLYWLRSTYIDLVCMHDLQCFVHRAYTQSWEYPTQIWLVSCQHLVMFEGVSLQVQSINQSINQSFLFLIKRYIINALSAVQWNTHISLNTYIYIYSEIQHTYKHSYKAAISAQITLFLLQAHTQSRIFLGLYSLCSSACLCKISELIINILVHVRCVRKKVARSCRQWKKVKHEVMPNS